MKIVMLLLLLVMINLSAQNFTCEPTLLTPYGEISVKTIATSSPQEELSDFVVNIYEGELLVGQTIAGLKLRSLNSSPYLFLSDPDMKGHSLPNLPVSPECEHSRFGHDDRLAGAAARNVLMGRWDLNGDGQLEDVYNRGSSIAVVYANGSSRSYYIAHAWWLLQGGVADTDGQPGCEMMFNIGNWKVKIICDRETATREYNLASNWWLLQGGVADTDGQPGCEVVFNIGYGKLRILCDRLRTTRDRAVALNWVLLYGGVVDTDGQPGCEIVFNIAPELLFLCDRNGSKQNYHVGLNWSLHDICDHNNIPGAEVIYNKLSASDAYARYAICDALKKQYPVALEDWR